MPYEIQGHTVPHWKVLKYGKYEPKGPSCGTTFNICQDVLKSDNLLHHKLKGFIDSKMKTTAC